MTASSAAMRLWRPDATTIEQFVAAQSGSPFSYSAVGCTNHSTGDEVVPVPGYVLDHNRALLGFGEKTFQRAVAALCDWGMFDIGWVELHQGNPEAQNGKPAATHSPGAALSPPLIDRALTAANAATLPAVGTTVCVLAKVLGVSSAGLWIMNACRVQRHIDTPPTETAPRRFGFAYGTLAGHIERGEERFLIEHSATDDSVTYDLLAISQPAHWLAKLGRPIARLYQKRFARDSMRAMQRLVVSDAAPPSEYPDVTSSG